MLLDSSKFQIQLGCVLSFKHLCLVSTPIIYHGWVSNTFICNYVIPFCELQRGLSECLDFQVTVLYITGKPSRIISHVTLLSMTIFYFNFDHYRCINLPGKYCLPARHSLCSYQRYSFLSHPILPYLYCFKNKSYNSDPLFYQFQESAP